MRISLFRAAAVAAICCVVVAAHAAQVRTAAFTVDLPGDFPAFETKRDVQKSGDKTVETTTWISRSPSTTEAFIVAVTPMPGKVADAKKLFDKTRDALLTSVKGTLESDETSGQQEVPARSLMIRAPGAFIRARLMLSGNDLYQILYVARSTEHLASNDVAALFSSLRVEGRHGDGVKIGSK